MNAIPYFFPIITMAIVAMTDNEVSIWYIILLYLCTAAAHFAFRRMCLYSKEYIGSYVSKIVHNDSWIERVTREERVRVGTDRSGNAIYRNVKKTEFVKHPDTYEAELNTDKVINITEDFYVDTKELWGTPVYNFAISGNNIVGGVRHYHELKFFDVRKQYMSDLSQDVYELTFQEPALGWKTVTITTTGRYKNKVRNSSSLFKFEKITDNEAAQLGLYQYPQIIGYDQSCILGNNVDVNEQRLYKLFNACYGKKYQIRLFVLLFDARKGVEIAEKQRAYWSGGNKNEFVVCLGVDGSQVKWCHCFCWMDEPVLSAKVENYFHNNQVLDLYSFNMFLRQNIGLWKRKEFKDFDYVHASYKGWQYILWLSACVTINIIALWIAFS